MTRKAREPATHRGQFLAKRITVKAERAQRSEPKGSLDGKSDEPKMHPDGCRSRIALQGMCSFLWNLVKEKTDE
jgi:hypothetical protein